MEKVKSVLLITTFMISCFAAGCSVKMDTRNCPMNKKEKAEFAELVAKKVIELQNNQTQVEN